MGEYGAHFGAMVSEKGVCPINWFYWDDWESWFLIGDSPFCDLDPVIWLADHIFSTGLLLCLCGVLLYFVLVKTTKRIFAEELVVVTEEVQREKTSVLLRRICLSRQAWALFFVILALWEAMLALSARGLFRMGSICMR